MNALKCVFVAAITSFWNLCPTATSPSTSVEMMKTIMSSSIHPCFSNRAEINCVDKEPKLLNPDWMSKLPDDVKLSKIAIPGTHQSGALYGGSLLQCQVWNITGQLLAGIRHVYRIEYPYS